MTNRELLALKLAGLADLRRESEATERARREKLEAMQADPEYVELANQCKVIGDALEQAEQDVRSHAVAAYQEEGKDGLPAGVKVVHKRKVGYTVGGAIKWCLTNAPEFLRLSARDFESYCLKVQDIKPVPVVYVEEELQAQISKDLSEYVTK